MPKKLKKLFIDLVIFSISCVLALHLIQNGELDNFIVNVLPVRYLAEFISGVLFTSALSTPFSLAMFYVLSDSVPPLQVALIGGLGAALGDMIIVKIFRDSFFDDVETARKTLKIKRPSRILHNPFFRFFAPILGVIIIASPFPDELGLMLLGASKLKTSQLLILTYFMNAAGIYLLSLGARNI